MLKDSSTSAIRVFHALGFMASDTSASIKVMLIFWRMILSVRGSMREKMTPE